jgi:hypothetical protein
MRTRAIALGVTLSVALGLVTAAPASAAYGVSIDFPGSHSEFYSAFAGPATITFTFVPEAEEDATFGLRLRSGGTLIHKDTVFVDGDDLDGVVSKTFKWPALSVNSPKTYEVAVYRSGAFVTSESFQLRPRLVTVTGATPNPFFPWIDDGYRDTTNVRFTLAADAGAEAHVHKPNSAGKCCGPLVRNDDLGTLSAGNNNWIWDGRGEDAFAGNLAKGNYFVRIRADDGVVAPAISKGFKVTIQRTYRALSTKSKSGPAYHHTTETALVRGGDCFLHNNGGALQIDCHGARMTVFYRWGLASDERIEKASFVIDDPYNECGPARWSKGFSKHESSITVTDNVSGITSCLVVTAKITYSHPESS